jgi:hypothetical protein
MNEEFWTELIKPALEFCVAYAENEYKLFMHPHS